MPVSLIFKRNGYSRKRWFMFNLSCNRGRMMNEMDDPFCRDRMRIEVARRLVCHQARTRNDHSFYQSHPKSTCDTAQALVRESGHPASRAAAAINSDFPSNAARA